VPALLAGEAKLGTEEVEVQQGVAKEDGAEATRREEEAVVEKVGEAGPEGAADAVAVPVLVQQTEGQPEVVKAPVDVAGQEGKGPMAVSAGPPPQEPAEVSGPAAAEAPAPAAAPDVNQEAEVSVAAAVMSDSLPQAAVNAGGAS
jgi:hypothetical protein